MVALYLILREISVCCPGASAGTGTWGPPWSPAMGETEVIWEDWWWRRLVPDTNLSVVPTGQLSGPGFETNHVLVKSAKK